MSRIVWVGLLLASLVGCARTLPTARPNVPVAPAARGAAQPCVAKLDPAVEAGLTRAMVEDFKPAVASAIRYVDAHTFSNGHMGVTGFATLTEGAKVRQVIFWTTYDPAAAALEEDATTMDDASRYGACGED